MRRKRRKKAKVQVDVARCVQMYSMQELSDEVHRTFQLPGDPYSSDEAIEYLRQLSIIFFRDQLHSRGVLIQPYDDDDTPIVKRRGWLAYKSSCTLDAITFCVLDKPGATEKYIAKRNSNKWWQFFNTELHIIEINEKMVRAI